MVLSFRTQVKVGDWMETSDCSGQVMEIQLDKFMLKEEENNLVIIPNPMKNGSLATRTRITLNGGVGYESDLDMVKQLSLDPIGGLFKQQGDEEIEFFYNLFGDRSINFILRFWTDATKAKQKHQALSDTVIGLKKAFDGKNVNIPFPIRTVVFNNNLNMKKITSSQE
ncbi:MAG: small conductance mechanosensitive channel [Rubritalea sp.]